MSVHYGVSDGLLGHALGASFLFGVPSLLPANAILMCHPSLHKLEHYASSSRQQCPVVLKRPLTVSRRVLHS